MSSAADALSTLQLQIARWQALLDSAQDAIISINAQGIVTLFNRAAEAMFGYAAEEVLGHNLVMLMPAPYCNEHAEYVARYERTGEARAIGRVRDVQALRKNGEVFPIELSVSEARNAQEHIYTAIVRDVSERVRTQAELHELQQHARQRERLADIGAITAHLVHDLGNPLAAISMQAQLLIRKLERNAGTDQLIATTQHVLSSIHRLDLIMQEFSNFTREQRLDLTELALPDLLRSLRDLWLPLASSRGIELALELPATPIPLRADGPKLSRVLENLLKNAIEAIDCGPGRVTIHAAATAGTVHIHVADTGPGISPNIDVFALFETTKTDGTGLGLAIAKQIVIAHGGSIGFESRTPHGTSFYIDLPAQGPAM